MSGGLMTFFPLDNKWTFVIVIILILFYADFSYMTFMNGKGLSKDSELSVNDMKDLMDTLGITDFLQKEQCTTVGWINGKIYIQKLLLRYIYIYIRGDLFSFSKLY